MAAAFNGIEPIGALEEYVDQLLPDLAAAPSILRLTYYRNSEDQSAANARLDALEDLIRDKWDHGYRLTIERIIRRTQ